MGFIASRIFLLWHLSTPATIVASSTVMGRGDASLPSPDSSFCPPCFALPPPWWLLPFAPPPARLGDEEWPCEPTWRELIFWA